MLENPDAGPTAVIKKAIQDGNYAANGVSFGNFKIKVMPEEGNFAAVWWTQLHLGAFGNPIAFYRYTGNNAPYFPLGDVIALESPEAWRSNFGKLWPLPGGGVMLFAPGDDNPDIFAHPTGFTRLLSDAGSHNTRDVVYYRMTPPPGYEAVGICFTNDEPPNANNYWCVNRKYLQAVNSVEAWSDVGAGWREANGSLNAATFAKPSGSPPATTDLASGDSILILPPAYVSVQDLANERAYALVGQQAMLPVLPFDPPDPPDDPKIMSGATTTYGLGRVAIVPYTAVSADAWYGQQAIVSPFYFIASEPYWECVESGSTGGGGSLTWSTTIGVSETQASSFTDSTSMTVGCEVGAKFGDLSSKVTVSYTRAFSLTTSKSTTHSSSTTLTETRNFPKQQTTWVWYRQTQIAVFRTDQSHFNDANYGNNDLRFVPDDPLPP
jgi:hypothetical protein